MNRLQKFRALTTSEKAVFLRASTLFPLVAIALRVLGMRGCQKLLGRLSLMLPGAPTLGRVRVAHLVNIAAYHGLYTANCLQRSLALSFELQRVGIENQLRIGISNDGQFKAHAWIEHEGAVLNDSPEVLREYSPFPEAIDITSRRVRRRFIA